MRGLHTKFAAAAVIFASFLAILLVTTNSCQASENTIELTPDQTVQLVRRLILENRLNAADRLLAALESDPERVFDVLFLKGQIAERRNDYARAATYYRAILADDPSLSRVRLDLARSLFLAGEYDAAGHHFDLALTKTLPEAVRQTVEAFRSAIRRRKRWTIDIALGATPDSNLNAAPDDNQVILFGLPFDLSEDARETSGIGIVARGAASYRLRLYPWLQWSSSVSARHAEYDGKTFDDTLASILTGPRVVLAQSAVSLSASYSRRWFGHRSLFDGVGIRAGGEHQLTPHIRIGGVIGFDQIDNKVNDQRDGPSYSALLQSVIGINNVSLARVFAGFSREVVESKPLRNWRFRLGSAYRREWAFGLSTDFNLEAGFRPFDSILAAFGKRREDVTVSAGIQVIKRDWRLWGFVPVAGYTYTRNSSNLEFFSYSRHRGELQVTRIF